MIVLFLWCFPDRCHFDPLSHQAEERQSIEELDQAAFDTLDPSLIRFVWAVTKNENHIHIKMCPHPLITITIPASPSPHHYQPCQRWPPSSSARRQAGSYEPPKKTSSHHFNIILQNAGGTLSLSNFNLTVAHKIWLILLHPLSSGFILKAFYPLSLLFRLLFLSVHWARRLPVFRSLPYSTQVGINLTSLFMCVHIAVQNFYHLGGEIYR